MYPSSWHILRFGKCCWIVVISQEKTCMCARVCVHTHTHTHTHTHSSKRSRKSQRGDKVTDSGLGRILRGHLRVCLFLDYGDRAIRKNRLYLSCSMPPSREARKHIRPYLVTVAVGPPLVPILLAGCCGLLWDVEGLPLGCGRFCSALLCGGHSPLEPGSVHREVCFSRRVCCFCGLKHLPTVANGKNLGQASGENHL